MNEPRAIVLGGMNLELVGTGGLLGTKVFSGLVGLAGRALTGLRQACPGPIAVVSRLRGTGRGVSSSALFDALERDHPIQLEAPFEGSDLVSGAVWRGDRIVGSSSPAAVARLLWDKGAKDLPMHVHEQSDRFIVVRRGRGYFHVSDQSVDAFDGTRVLSIPARERDVFLFTRGIVHTFSTDAEPMELFSCQLPFVPFDHPDQYRIPTRRWTAATHRDPLPPKVACDAAWTVLSRQGSSEGVDLGTALGWLPQT